MLLINRNYGIESDNLNITLLKREVSKEKGSERWRAIGHFSTFGSALKGLVDMEVRGDGLGDFETVVKKIDELYELINSLKEEKNAL